MSCRGIVVTVLKYVSSRLGGDSLQVYHHHTPLATGADADADGALRLVKGLGQTAQSRRSAAAMHGRSGMSPICGVVKVLEGLPPTSASGGDSWS